MTWLIWRQQRKSFLALAVLLVLYAVMAIPTGLHFARTYEGDLSACNGVATCAALDGRLSQSVLFSNLSPSQPSGGFNLVVLIMLALPFLLGMFIGVPLICREYETRTNLLIWTRSVSRRKWLTVKLLWTLAATVAFSGLVAALTTWSSDTGNALYINRFDTLKFDLQGVVPVAFVVFAVSIGIALGTWLKRIMAAVGIMFIVLLAFQTVVGSYIRPHYMIPMSYDVSLQGNNYHMSPSAPPDSGSSWIISGQIVGTLGQILNWASPPPGCVVANFNGIARTSGTHTSAEAQDGIVSMNGRAVDMKCLDELGYHWSTKYQPADRYWKFQLIETGLYILLSVALLGATYWLVLRRDA